MSSFFPEAITSWNNVIAHFNDIPSFSILKNRILSLIRPKKKCILGIHLPTKSELKFLKISQKCHKFIDTPSDKCLCNQGIEDTNHFLFWGPF